MKLRRILNKFFIVLLIASLVLSTAIGIAIKDIHALEKPVKEKVLKKHEPVVKEVEIKEKVEFVDVEEIDAEKEIQKIDEAKKAREAEELAAQQAAEEQAALEAAQAAAQPVVELTIEERIRQACESYGIRFDIALAISRLETGWFKSYAYIHKNNPGGLSRNEKPMAFRTIEEGVDAFVRNLANNYFAHGLDTPSEIGQKYCPRNPRWASMVEELMSYGY